MTPKKGAIPQTTCVLPSFVAAVTTHSHMRPYDGIMLIILMYHDMKNAII